MGLQPIDAAQTIKSKEGENVKHINANLQIHRYQLLARWSLQNVWKYVFRSKSAYKRGETLQNQFSKLNLGNCLRQ